MMVLPDPALAPVMPPVTVPTVQVKLLATVAVSAIFGPVPLHVETEDAVVTAGLGFTVTVMEYTGPAHEPVTDLGVTMY